MVIRVYKQNVSSGNIGVNVAGANTTSSSFASLSNTFNSFANNMFNEAAKKAQKEGVQSAQEATISNILQINPKTGNPVAYQEEGIYGSIFTDAFNEIIDRRYVAGIQEDLINANRNLASKYSLDVKGYQNAFTQYYTAKINNANPKYVNLVTEQSENLITGTSITIANNVAAYQKKQAEAQYSYETNKELEMAYELGTSGASFEKFTQFLMDVADKTAYQKIGITTDSDISEHRKQLSYMYLTSKLKNKISALPKTQLDPDIIKIIPDWIKTSIQTNGQLPVPSYGKTIIKENGEEEFILDPGLEEIYKVVDAINAMRFTTKDHEAIIKSVNSSDQALEKYVNDWVNIENKRIENEKQALNNQNLTIVQREIKQLAKKITEYPADGEKAAILFSLKARQVMDIIKNLEGDNTDEINQLKDISQNLGITIVDDIVRSMTNDLYKIINKNGVQTYDVKLLGTLRSDIREYIESGARRDYFYLSDKTKELMNLYTDLYGAGDISLFQYGVTDQTYRPNQFPNFSIQSVLDRIDNDISLKNEYLQQVNSDLLTKKEEAIIAAENLMDQYLVLNDISNAEAIYLELGNILDSHDGFDPEKKDTIRKEALSKLGSFRLSEVIRDKYSYDVPVDKLEAVINYLNTENLDSVFQLDRDLFNTIKELNLKYGNIFKDKDNLKAFLEIEKKKTIESQKRLANLKIANNMQSGRTIGNNSTNDFLKTIKPQEANESSVDYQKRIEEIENDFLIYMTNPANMEDFFMEEISMDGQISTQIKPEIMQLARYGNFPFEKLFEVLDVYYDGREDLFPDGSSIVMPLKLLQEFVRNENGNLLSPQFMTDITGKDKTPWISFINYIDKNPNITGEDGVLLTGDAAIKEALKRYTQRIQSGFVDEQIKKISAGGRMDLKAFILEQTDLDAFGPTIDAFEDIINSAIAVEGLDSPKKIKAAIKDLEENIFPKSSIVFENINNLNSNNNTQSSLEKLTGENTQIVVNEMLMKNILPAMQNVEINYNGQVVKLSDFPINIGDYETFNHDLMSIENANVFERRSQLQNKVDPKPALRLHVNSLENQRERAAWEAKFGDDYNSDGTLKEEKKVALYSPIEIRLMPLNNELPNDIMLESNLGHPSEIDNQVFFATKDNKKYAVFFKLPDQSWNDGLPLMETKSAIQMDATTLHHYKTIADGTFMKAPIVSNSTVYGALVPNTNILKYYVVPRVFDGKIYPDNNLKDLEVLHKRILQDYKMEEFPSFYNIDDAIFWLEENKKHWLKNQVTTEEAKDIIAKSQITFQEAVVVDPLAINRKYDEINAFKDESSANFDATLNEIIIRDIATFDFESNKLIENYFTNNFEENYAPPKPPLSFNVNFLQSKRKQKAWNRKYGEYFDADGTLKTGVTIFPLLLEEYNKIISINGLPSTHPKFYKKGLTYWDMWKRNFLRSFPASKYAEKKGLLLSE